MLLGWLPLSFSLWKNFLGETGYLGSPYFLLTGCLSIQFFGLPLTLLVRPPAVNYHSLCSTSVTYRMPCHAIGHKVFPMQPLPREVEDFPRVCNHSKHMSLLNYLSWLQPIRYNPKFVFNHVKTAKILLAVKTLIKKQRAAATLISSHKSEN